MPLHTDHRFDTDRPRNQSSQGTWRWYALIVFAFIVSLMGGASRADVASLPLLRVFAACTILGAVVLIPRSVHRRAGRPLFLIIAFAAIVASQLMPVPHELWAALPGREPFVAAAESFLDPSGWRAISLTPALTLNTIFALSVPLAAILLANAQPRDRDDRMVYLLLAIGCVSATMGLLQSIGPEGSALNLYRIHTPGAPTGLFANRNHQAVVLAGLLPFLTHLGLHRQKRFIHFTGMAFGVSLAAAFFLAIILMSGSRAGLLGAIVGLILSAFIFYRRVRHISASGEFRRKALLLVLGVVAIVTILMGLTFNSDNLAVGRLLRSSALEEQRIDILPKLLAMAVDFFPVGSGFGSFENVYYAYEGLGGLTHHYVNQAHNDFLQIAIEGGAAACLLLIGSAAWFIRQFADLVMTDVSTTRWSRRFAAGSFILILALGSIVDYPLRTPLAATMFAICCVLLGRLHRY